MVSIRLRILESSKSKLSGVRELDEHDGFAVVPACLDEATVQLLSEQFDDARPPERNLLSVPSIQALAISKPVREIMETVLGPECFAVRGIFFQPFRLADFCLSG